MHCKLWKQFNNFSMSKFDKQTLSRLVDLILPVFRSEIRLHMFGLIGLLASFALIMTGANVVMSYLMSYVMTALSLKDGSGFFTELAKYVVVAICFATPIAVFYRYTEERFALKWRRWLSLYFIRRYLSNRSYYSMQSYAGIDNPDQRLEEDVRSFTTQCVSFSLIIFNSIIALTAFMGILWRIDKLLPVAAVFYAGIGSLCTYLLGRPLISLSALQLSKEANYRYKLINLRENAESIAFYRSEEKEFTRVRQRLRDALKNLLKIINRNRSLGFFVTGYNHMTVLIPTVIVARKYLDGSVDFGVITQSQGAFAQVLGALSLIVVHFGGLSSFAAVITRLGTFSEALDELALKPVGDHIKIETDNRIELKAVTVYTPNRSQLLMEEISFAVNSGGLLITGPSGCGKSSILRTIAGIWGSGEGTIIRPRIEETFFLPQRPYAVTGTLRSQLLYALGKVASTEELNDVIEKVGLNDTLRRAGGIDVEREWGRLLSSGELQRVAWARLFLAKPKFVFLDEATTALDIGTEQALYAHVTKSTAIWVSVGLRQTMYDFHGNVLELTGEGKWRLVCFPVK